VGRRGITIIDESGTETEARVAGRVYHEIQPVAGDNAVASATDGVPVVTAILPRSGILQRTAALGSSTQIIAANVDMVLVIMSVRKPDFTDGFLSRTLVAADFRDLKATVVLNKVDLNTSKDEVSLKRILSVYGQNGAGYPVFVTSCLTGQGTRALLDHIKGLTVVMTGPSGAGKTSLAKYYNPDLDVKIGALNPKTSKGKHTTVSAKLIPLKKNTWLIDTPGLKMFSIDHVPKEELQYCFPEFDDYLGECKFRDCLHLSEPGCAVKAALREGNISEIRYDTYSGFMRNKS